MQQRASLASSTSNPQRFSVGAARTSRRPVLYSTSALVRDESSGSRSCRRPGAFGFPRLAHLLAPRQHIFLGIIEAFVNSRALDHVAGAAASYKVSGILLAASRARSNELNRHYPR